MMMGEIGTGTCFAFQFGCSWRMIDESSLSFLQVSQLLIISSPFVETRYDSVLVAQVLYILYGFLVVILLSNVLIAIVTDSYEVIQNDRYEYLWLGWCENDSLRSFK